MKRLLQASLLALVTMLSCAHASETKDIIIRRADGRAVTFTVELATDDASRERGLMFRKNLPAMAGMLFVYEHPANRQFWMKNTLIPLDMLFFAPDGRVVFIHPSATPGSLEPVGPDGPEASDVCAVLEIAGGEAARLGIGPGDRLVLTDSSACLP